MIRAAIFDLDGTLVDSNDLHVQAVAIYPGDLLANLLRSPLG